MALVSTCIACICMTVTVTAHCLRLQISTVYRYLCSSINSSRFRSRIWNSFCVLTVDWTFVLDVRHSDRASLPIGRELTSASCMQCQTQIRI